VFILSNRQDGRIAVDEISVERCTNSKSEKASSEEITWTFPHRWKDNKMNFMVSRGQTPNTGFTSVEVLFT
jgi:hypothetical protein